MSKKQKVWSTDKADKEFSLYIRGRDGRCQRCGKTENLQCSHFWSRQHSSTRYDPDNCVALCGGCHIFNWEKEKQGAYRDFMLRWLKEDKFKELEKRRYLTVQRRDAIINCMKLLGKWTTTPESVKA